ncbi:MAG: hypothetical protein ACLQGP_30725, partial [Isosphaeraceae bacterium]
NNTAQGASLPTSAGRGSPARPWPDLRWARVSRPRPWPDLRWARVSRPRPWPDRTPALGAGLPTPPRRSLCRS